MEQELHDWGHLLPKVSSPQFIPFPIAANNLIGFHRAFRFIGMTNGGNHEIQNPVYNFHCNSFARQFSPHGHNKCDR